MTPLTKKSVRSVTGTTKNTTRRTNTEREIEDQTKASGDRRLQPMDQRVRSRQHTFRITERTESTKAEDRVCPSLPCPFAT